MSEPQVDADTPSAAEPSSGTEDIESGVVAPPAVATDEPEIDREPPGRPDSLATGVAVLVMAALLSCAAIVLIAANNA